MPTSCREGGVESQRFVHDGIINLPDGGLVAVVNGKLVDEKSLVDGAAVKKIDREPVPLHLNEPEITARLYSMRQGESVTNYLHLGGATNNPSRYYRVRLF